MMGNSRSASLLHSRQVDAWDVAGASDVCDHSKPGARVLGLPLPLPCKFRGIINVGIASARHMVVVQNVHMRR